MNASCHATAHAPQSGCKAIPRGDPINLHQEGCCQLAAAPLAARANQQAEQCLRTQCANSQQPAGLSAGACACTAVDKHNNLGGVNTESWSLLSQVTGRNTLLSLATTTVCCSI